MFEINELNIKKQKPIAKRTINKYDNYLVKGTKNGEVFFEGNILNAVRELKNNDKNRKTNIPPSGIFKCASGYYPVYFKYTWEFVKEEDKNEHNILFSEKAKEKLLNLNDDNRRKIIVFDSEGEPIIGFDHIVEAVRWLNEKHNKKVDYKSIIFVAKNYNNYPNDPKKARSSKGFIWRFYDDVRD